MASALAVPNSPEHRAHAIVLADARTGDILYSQNMHDRIEPASVTKIMTALLAIEALDRGEVNVNDLLTTSEAALADMIPYAASIHLQVGEEMTFESLLHAIMLVSANDASNVVAEHLGGSIPGFLEMMNARARELGAMNTHFTNTHGLPGYNHYSTAYDIFRITQHAIANPRFADLYSMQERLFPATNMRPAGVFHSTNRMTDPNAAEYYPGVFGVKTGFTDAAGFCLVSTAVQGDIYLLAVVMGVPIGIEGVNHFTETAAIYDWAFANLEYTELIPITTEITRIPIALGDGADTVGLRPQRTVNALLLAGTSLGELRRDVILFENVRENLTAPVNQGDVLGELTLHYNGRSFGPIPLVAAETVNLSRTDFIWDEITNTLGSPLVLGVLIVLGLLFLLYIVYAITYSVKKRRRRRERMNRNR